MRWTRLAKTLVMTFFVGLSACEGPAQQPTQSVTQPPQQDPSVAAQFAAVNSAAPGSAEVFGTYTRGCIAGARQLMSASLYWQIMHPSRNRAWGHPHLIAMITTLAETYAHKGHHGLLIGDLAQPRGGPLPSDHNSHQMGLDADIWLTPMPKHRLPSHELEGGDLPSFVDFDELKITPTFSHAQFDMIYLAAIDPRTERIFVSPVIKKELCKRSLNSDQSWLSKVRPWRGHAAHMHVRLSCPAGSTYCNAQEPPPPGDGCGEELESWFQDTSWARPSRGTYAPEKPIQLDSLPHQCRRLLKQNS